VAGAALAATPVAEAVIIYSGPINLVIPATTAGVYLNLVTGASGSTPAAAPGWDINPYSSTGLSWFAATPNATSGYMAAFGSSVTLVDNLPNGTIVGPAQSYVFNNGSETTGSTAFLFNSEQNYVGFRFVNEPAGIVNYGWLQLRLGSSLTDPTRAIIGYYYEDSGAPIAAGPLTPPMPEPSPLLLAMVAALGALGLRFWRLAFRRS
jgi:hypothetical protein